jgi:hypothetical protein
MWHGMSDEQVERVAREWKAITSESASAAAAEKQSAMKV